MTSAVNLDITHRIALHSDVCPSRRAIRRDDLRLGQAAELLGVSPDTLRRWEADGRLATHRSAGGQRPRRPRRGPPAAGGTAIRGVASPRPTVRGLGAQPLPGDRHPDRARRPRRCRRDPRRTTPHRQPDDRRGGRRDGPARGRRGRRRRQGDERHRRGAGRPRAADVRRRLASCWRAGRVARRARWAVDRRTLGGAPSTASVRRRRHPRPPRAGRRTDRADRLRRRVPQETPSRRSSAAYDAVEPAASR